MKRACSGSAPARRRGFQGLVLACLLVDFVAMHVGAARPFAAYFEWVLIGQVFVLWPLTYVALVYPRTRQKALLPASMALGMLFGGLALDASWKHAWRYVDPLRWVLVTGLAAVEVVVMAMLLRSLHRLRHSPAPERAIADTVRGFLGSTWAARLVAAEFRMWFYALLAWRRRTPMSFDGTAFFTVHRHQGNASNQQAFLWLIGAEIPLAHFLVALWHPRGAWVVTLLSAYGWLWMLAEYRATLLRPVSLDDAHLHLRYGLLGDEAIRLEAIVAVEPCSHRPRRRSGLRRYLAGGAPNACLTLHPGVRVDHVFGSSAVDTIVLAVDEPARFVASLGERLRQRQDASARRTGSGPATEAGPSRTDARGNDDDECQRDRE